MFDLNDLGLLENGQETEFDTLCELSTVVAEADGSVLILSEPVTGNAVIKGRHVSADAGGPTALIERRDDVISAALTSAFVRCVEDSEIDVTDAGRASEIHVSRAFIAAPIAGPAGETIGSLIVHSNRPRVWSDDQERRVAALAKCVSRNVLLRATMETLKLVSRETVIAQSAALH